MESAPAAPKTSAKQLFLRRMAISFVCFIVGAAFLLYARLLLGKVVDEMVFAMIQPGVTLPHSTLPALMLACKYSGFFLTAVGLGYAVYAMAAHRMSTTKPSTEPKPLVAWKYFLGGAALVFAAVWQFGKLLL